MSIIPNNSHERVSPEVARKVWERWGVVYASVEDTHQILKTQDNAAVRRPHLTLMPEARREVNAAPVADVALNGATQQEQLQQVALTRQEQEIQIAQQAVNAIHGEAVIPEARDELAA